MSNQEDEEFGLTWENVLRDRGYSEEVIAELRAKRDAKYELHFEE